MRRWLRQWRTRLFMPVLSSQAAYARWAADYPPYAHNALMRCEENLMRQRLPDLQGKTVLDLACGTGRYGLIADDGGAGQIIGCDNSPAMLAANPLPGLALADLARVPLPHGSVDVLLCGLAIGHVPDLEAVLKEISRVLKPGGVALVSDFHPAQYASGGQRSFRDSDGKVYTVEHHPHAIETLRQTAESTGVHVTAVDEASVPGAPSQQPAVVVYQLELRG